MYVFKGPVAIDQVTFFFLLEKHSDVILGLFWLFALLISVLTMQFLINLILRNAIIDFSWNTILSWMAFSRYW